MENSFTHKIQEQELQLLGEEFEQLFVSHIQWVKNIQKCIICNLPYDKKLNENHKSCSFGKWYDSVNNTVLLKSPEFIKLGNVHKKIHVESEEILNSYENKQKIKIEDYESFSETQDEFMVCINSFSTSINSARFQIDGLTKLPNRNLILQILEQEHSRSLRKKRTYCVGIADIDFFKNINDNYGHLAGDETLRQVSQFFLASMREYDSIGRYGGEEFIICMPETSLKEAKLIMEKLCKHLAELTIKINETSCINITCSFGLSELNNDLSLTEIINNSDIALYSAKNSGRNKVVAWSENS